VTGSIRCRGRKTYQVSNEAEKTAYAVGRTKVGRWAGVKTTIVETWGLPPCLLSVG
jgi:hypothetical protein